MEQSLLKENGVYQIYPISFKDSNTDGKGDLKGIISKLDYLQSIGVKIIWLSPIYVSPMIDMGYDVADYKNINPIFGTMEDFDNLISETKKRDMKVVMDLVVNHTSSEHYWFKEALANPNSKYRKYYYFRKGKNGGYPNNWTSTFTGPAWEKVEGEDDMYYLHLFSKYQPDLDFHSEELIQEVESILKFWFDKGIYGFRCDVISCFYKNSLEDGKVVSRKQPVGLEHYVGVDKNLEIIQRFRKNVVDKYNGILIGEFSSATTSNVPRYVDSGALDTFFSFDHVDMIQTSLFKNHVNPKVLKKALVNWQENVNNNGVYFENHDQNRVNDKYIKKGYYNVGSKMMLTLVYTLKGIPFIYQGQELGSFNYPKGFYKFKETNDVCATMIYDSLKKLIPFKLLRKKFAMHISRDPERAPMAFDSSPTYGFTSSGVKPWQKFNPRAKDANVLDEEKDPNSVLNYYKKLVAIRKNSKTLCYGDIKFIKTYDDVLLYTRSYNGDTILVQANLSHKKRDISKDIASFKIKNNIISNYSDSNKKLRPYEIIVSQI